MLWLALHFPRLPLEIFTARHNNPQSAIVLLHKNRVFMCNPTAKDYGIAVGSTLATACSIEPEVVHGYRDIEAEATRLSTLADILYRFSSYVSVQHPDCVILEIGGSLKLFGCHQQLMDEAIKLASTLGHDVCARTAATPWAAIALARSAQHDLNRVPLGTAGLETAGIDKGIVEHFANMGIYTLGPLLNLPNKPLGRRFGGSLLTYLGQLTGTLPDPRQAITPARGFTRQLHLLSPIRDKGELFESPYSPMQKMSDELQQWLISHQLGCERLLWRFTSHHQQSADMLVRFAKGKQNQRDFMRVSQLRLEQISLPEEILSVSLAAKHLGAWRNRSQSLFALHPSLTCNDDENINNLVDELNARLGDTTCQGIQEVAQHTPESAWQCVHTDALASHHSLTSRSNSTSPFPKQSFLKRPLWLFDSPRQVRRSDLKLLCGPERIQSQWWQAESTHRDYYIAQHCLGAECWVFKGVDTQWYLHGYFG